MNLRPLLALLFVSVAAPTRAQFYAPDTEYHDIAQRVFPVEAARVIAWQRAAGGQAPIFEVTYQVSVTPQRETVWKIQWVDAAKKPVREKEVRYAEDQLSAGAGFYRQIFSQIEGEDWKIGAGSPDNAATTFWQGAEISGGTRLDAINAARTFVREKPKMARAADAARLAGILCHATLPHFGRQVSLDPVFLGRAAAWLCIAEARSHEKFDASWVPVLFLSGRENAAKELAGTALWRAAEKQSAAERFWRLLASGPNARDMLLFGARIENKTFAMPMLSYVASLEASLAAPAAEVGEDVIKSAGLARMSEYSLKPIQDGAKRSAENLNEFLMKWEQSLAEFEPAELANTGYQDAVKLMPPLAGSEAAPSRVRRLGPLLNLGLDQGSGPLTPVGYITSRDALGFGWEMACLLSSEYYDALKQPGGNPEDAKPILSAALGSIKGANVFFDESAEKVLAPLDSPARVQYVGSARAQAALLKKLPATWTAPPDMPPRRQWLSRAATRECVMRLVDDKAADGVIEPIVERLIREGGRGIVMDLLQMDSEPKYSETIKRNDLRDAVSTAASTLGEVDPTQLKSEFDSASRTAAAEASIRPADPNEKIDISKLKTADEFWAALQKLRDIPRQPANSPEDRMRQIRAWLDQRRAVAEAFLKAYPNDPRRHVATLVVMDSALQLDVDAKIDNDALAAVIGAKDIDEPTRGEAEFFKLMIDSRSVQLSSPHTVPPFQQALAAFLDKYPNHPRTPYIASMLMQLLSQFETPSTEPILKQLSRNSNPQIAMLTKTILQQRQYMLELKKKPLDLKFTAVDGTEVDSAKLRGKVVLLDFWASWCGPCMAEAPAVVETYKKLHDRGFEIVGISFDQDKAAMESAIQQTGMTWPQHFDGKAWEGEIAMRFGVSGIPSTWLFDKQGKLREHNLRGRELEARIENLLREK